MAWSYQNPVWPGYFADPFVLNAGGLYYAYGTGERLERDAQGQVWAFKILRSPDLVQWEPAGAALRVGAAEAGFNFWAPEVAKHDGRFYCYYSSGPQEADERHRLRVAVAEDPIGPFEDQGNVLPETEAFSIDAHPFRDPADGRWYLFYARDTFTGRVGTGLAVVPLTSDLLKAAQPPRTVLRPNADWQIYQRDRQIYGRCWPAWHTVEGPCVVAHEGRYYCFYSGGNWQTHGYGLSFGSAPHPLGPWTHAEGEEPAVLRQRPGEVLGPGHNSYTVAPDGRTELLVYHAWNTSRTARRMFIDPLVWTDQGPRCLGPTLGRQTVN